MHTALYPSALFTSLGSAINDTIQYLSNKTESSAWVLIITQVLGVAYILARGERPVGSGRDHTVL